MSIIIPSGIILIWSGANSAIPSQFTRETLLDATYAKGTDNAVDPNTSGGNANHTHTSPTHSHGLNSHTHTYTTDSVGNGSRSTGGGGDNQSMSGSHNHTGTSGNASGGTTSADAVTYGSVANDPPFSAVIFIKAGLGAVLANGIIGLWAGFGGNVSTPTNWNACDGGGVTPDLRNKYLKGAATAADAGTTGGSSTNIHNISHSHTAQTHTHTGAISNIPVSPTRNGSVTANPNAANYQHSHNVTGAAATQPIDSFAASLTTTETVEPAFTKLMAIQRAANGLKIRGLIGLWLGSLTSIPRGWVLCDGSNGTPDMRSRHLKVANDSSEIAATGGSNTHIHAAQSHTHTTSSGHTHGLSGAQDTISTDTNGTSSGVIVPPHTHTMTSDSTTATYAAANTTADSSSNEPIYRTVAFIQFQSETQGGAFLNIL